MAGTVVFSYEHLSQPIRKVVADWVSDASGDADASSAPIFGRILKVVTDPGSPAPTANYDIALTDEHGLDLLSNLGGTGGTAPTLANRHTSDTEVVLCRAEDSLTDPVAQGEPHVGGAVTVTVSNAGDSKAGRVVIYYQP